jgi:hypothetical protein
MQAAQHPLRPIFFHFAAEEWVADKEEEVEVGGEEQDQV